MKERPVLFSGPMIRALLAGRKWQTRRMMKPQPEPIPTDVQRVKPYDDSGFWWSCAGAKSMISMHDAPGACPYGTRGDRLWVKETWRAEERDSDGVDGVRFAADRSFHPIENTPEAADAWVVANDNGSHGTNWRPSLFMPRWASRLTLEVTEVRVQRLNDISEEDAKAEGLTCLTKDGGQVFKWGIPDRDGWPGNDDDGWHWHEWEVDTRRAFAKLWDRINGKRAPWASNPWLWCVSFRRVETP